MSVADNPEHCEAAERAACDRWPLEVVGDGESDWFDAEVSAPISTELSDGPIVEVGTPVEVKSCRRRYGGRNGRWWIKRANHERLLGRDGEYVLAVRDASGDVLRLSLLSARTVDAMISEWWDTGNGGGRDADEFRQIPWSAVFESVDPAGGSR